MLDQKRQALLREHELLAKRLAGAEDEWVSRARTAVDANGRALTLVGERTLRLAAAYSSERAELSIVRRNILGTDTPEVADVRLPEARDLVALGGPVVAIAASAHQRALEAGAAYAVTRAAYEGVATELALTNRRLSAIQRRWIPQHEQALARLDLALDESERDDIARVRWALEARDAH